ncbi:uncharacterized protein LOC113316178 [Papaver somniferum]|uniref:uncharacterized protein LOC113316178 n=1 Tax=Papaver somniferum TaxID=3469 RepID=UPI000E70557E|nr:uncharacterized protein LOC113316178 [Papaver somniferum]
MVPKAIYMNEFRSCISDNGLVEADAIGKNYTWSNRQSGQQGIVSKLDRVVVNDAWLYKYENWRCKALHRIASDHSPLFGFAFDNPRPARAPFRIHKMWLSHPRFMKLVEDNWKLRLDGAPPFVFARKLKRLKETLKLWNRTVYGDVQFHLKQDELRLEAGNDLLDYDPADELQFTKVMDAKKVVDDVRIGLAVMLKKKFKITWLEDGYRNTRFFTIAFNEITDYIVNYYKHKFNGGDVNIDPKLFEIDHECISAAESAYMDALPTLEEIKERWHSLHNMNEMLAMYQQASGQYVNRTKNKFYYECGSSSRAIAISNFLGMGRDLFSDRYLEIQ